MSKKMCYNFYNMKTYAMMVLGCKVNDYEAAFVEQELNKDYRKVSFNEVADIYLIFTCAVTNVAESKSRKFIRQAKRLNPNAYIVAIGCYVQTSPNEEVFENIDLLIGSQEKNKIKEYIDEGLKKNTIKHLDKPQFEEMIVHEYARKGRAFLKIQDGCNQFCSYCIIPYARGRERSADHNHVIEEARELSLHSKEIVLTGIHTGRYFDGEYHLIDLLKELVKIDTLNTIRLSSIEITEIHDDLIELMANNPKIARHLHIPLQSGSTKVLKDMHRPYDVEYFLKRIAEIRNKIPGISISTDLIAGFPGESDENHKETLNTLEKAQFSFIHLFPYARKKGTLADNRDDFVDSRIVEKRINEINELELKYKTAYKDSRLNTITKVFIERNLNGISYGYSSEYLRVEIEGSYPAGILLEVRIIATDPFVKGEVINVIE